MADVEDSSKISIDNKVERLDASFQMLCKQVDAIQAGDTKTYQDLRTFFLGMSTLAVLGGYLSYSINASQIKDNIKDTNMQVERSINDQAVKTNNNIDFLNKSFE